MITLQFPQNGKYTELIKKAQALKDEAEAIYLSYSRNEINQETYEDRYNATVKKFNHLHIEAKQMEDREKLEKAKARREMFGLPKTI